MPAGLDKRLHTVLHGAQHVAVVAQVGERRDRAASRNHGLNGRRPLREGGHEIIDGLDHARHLPTARSVDARKAVARERRSQVQDAVALEVDHCICVRIPRTLMDDVRVLTREVQLHNLRESHDRRRHARRERTSSGRAVQPPTQRLVRER